MTKKGEATERLRETLDKVRAERDDARVDFGDLKRFVRRLLKTEGVGAEELAVGLALVDATLSAWPHPYTCDVSRLATSAQVDQTVVEAALMAFEEAGALKT